MMKKQLFSRILPLIIFAALIIWDAPRLYALWAGGEAAGQAALISPAAIAQEAPGGAQAALRLPPLPKSPATMTAAEKSAAIDRAGKDAQAAAEAAGQTPAEIEQAGINMRKAADAAFHRPSDVGAL